MTNAKKYKTKTKNGIYKNNMFYAIVIGINIIFVHHLSYSLTL